MFNFKKLKELYLEVIDRMKPFNDFKDFEPFFDLIKKTRDMNSRLHDGFAYSALHYGLFKFNIFIEINCVFL